MLGAQALAEAPHDTTRQLLLDLTMPESLLLAAAVRLCYGRTRPHATFAMLLNEIEKGYLKHRVGTSIGLGGKSRADRTNRRNKYRAVRPSLLPITRRVLREGS